ncbi:hypothetical protein H634G_11771 [Metarhizium anisopliae BRIP 53293]|uniref:Uncharacterized protein n=1 Tax=Metarhizium anisopliae BRIP 53293 TaxID=1291518 RepID=A0A0D9NKV1_METAN|nr:hypothetical protein H634G_11771 [Metarhizium anisopliae BRIP 53293]
MASAHLGWFHHTGLPYVRCRRLSGAPYSVADYLSATLGSFLDQTLGNLVL